MLSDTIYLATVQNPIAGPSRQPNLKLYGIERIVAGKVLTLQLGSPVDIQMTFRPLIYMGRVHSVSIYPSSLLFDRPVTDFLA